MFFISLSSLRFAARARQLGSWLALLTAGILLPAAGRALTLDDAVRQALTGNRDLRAAYYEIDRARARLLQAGLWPNPTLEVNGRSDVAFNREGEGAFGAALSQAFPLTGRLRLAREVGRVDVAQAIEEIRNRERLLIGEVSRLFVQAVAGAEAIAVRREQAAANEEFATLARQRLESALGSEVDVNLARIEVERLRQEIALLEADRQGAVLGLRQRLGLLPTSPLVPEGSLESVAARLDENTRGRAPQALLRRPDRRRALLAADRAQAEVRLSRAEAWSDPTFGVAFDLDRTSDQPDGLRTDKFLGLRVAVPLPLFNRNQGRIREGLVAGRQAIAQVEALDVTIRSEIAIAAERAARLRDVTGGYAASLLPPAARNTDLLRQGFREGRVDFSLVFQAQSQRLTLRNAAVDARRERAFALVDLQTALASSPHLRAERLQRRGTPPPTPLSK